MQIYWYFGILIFDIIVYFIPIRAHVTYKREGGNDILTTETRIAGILVNHKSIPVFRIKIKDNQLSFEMVLKKKTANADTDDYSIPELISAINDYIKNLRRYYRVYNHIFAYLSKKLCCEKLLWRTILGTSDPALTGISTGLLWQFENTVLSCIAANFHFTNGPPVIEVKPDFDERKFHTYFEGIFTLKLGNIIVMLSKYQKIKISKYLTGRKLQRGGEIGA